MFDVGLSAALMAYAHDLHFGRIDPQAAGFKLDVEHSRLELIPLLQGISRAEDVGKGCTTSNRHSCTTIC